MNHPHNFLALALLVASTGAYALDASMIMAIQTLRNRSAVDGSSVGSAVKTRTEQTAAPAASPATSISDNGVAQAAQNMLQSFTAITNSTKSSDDLILNTASSPKPVAKSSNSINAKQEVVSAYYLDAISKYKNSTLADLQPISDAANAVVASEVAAGDGLVGAAIKNAATLSAGALRQEADRKAASEARDQKQTLKDRIANGEIGGAGAKISGKKKANNGFGYSLEAKAPKAPSAYSPVAGGSKSGHAAP